MQKASGHIAYAVANSNAMNGLSAGSRIVSVMPLWMKLLVALDVAAGIIVLCVVVITTGRLLKKKQSNAEIQDRSFRQFPAIRNGSGQSPS